MIPQNTHGYDANGVFVYRTISDLQKLMEFASKHKGKVAATVGGGLLGLEAAKALMDLEAFGNVKLIDRNRWVLARQLDADAGKIVTQKIRELGVDVMLSKRIAEINVDDENNMTGITFEDREKIDCCCLCYAVSTCRVALTGQN